MGRYSQEEEEEEDLAESELSDDFLDDLPNSGEAFLVRPARRGRRGDSVYGVRRRVMATFQICWRARAWRAGLLD